MTAAVEEARPELFYRNPEAALGWLERAFGLDTELVVTGADGGQIFARVSGGIAIVPEIPGHRQSPASTGGVATQQVMITLGDGIEAHCETARAAGARIEQDLRREFFGLTYTAADLEGHLWSFIQRVEGPPSDPPAGMKVRFPQKGRTP